MLRKITGFFSVRVAAFRCGWNWWRGGVLKYRIYRETLIKSCSVIVHPVLVLSNTELFIKNNIDLSYDVVRADELEEFITAYKDSLSESDRMFILQDIDECRIN